ncbi:MAG: hypothetical protein KA140_04185 [Caldisericia bacterium]|nr:hypothetical protein [Caldisericia bacterium]
MKTNKKRIILVLTTTALVLMASIITVLVTNTQKDFWEQRFDKYSSSFQNPFDNINSFVSNGFEITEFKCKGNQEIEKLQNGILQFSSLESIIRANINNKLAIPDKSNYIYNIKTGKSMKIGRFNSFSQKETDDQILEIRKVTDDNLSELTWIEPCVTFDGIYKQDEVKNITLPSVFANTEVTFLIFNLDLRNKKIKSELYKQTADKDIIFRDESTMIVAYPFPVNVYNQPSKIHLYKGNKSTPLASFDIGFRYASLYDRVGSKIIIKLKKEYMDDDFQLAVVDFNSLKFVELPNTFDDQKTKLLAGSGKIFFVDDYVSRKVMMLDLINGISKLFSAIDFDYDLVGVFGDKKGAKLLLSKQVKDNFSEKQYYIYDISSNQYKLLITGNFDILFTEKNCLIYTDHINKDNNGLPINKNQKIRLMITEINNAKSTVLNDDVSVSESVKVFSDGFSIAWTRNAGPKDDQWKNVCYTVLP